MASGSSAYKSRPSSKHGSGKHTTSKHGSGARRKVKKLPSSLYDTQDSEEGM